MNTTAPIRSQKDCWTNGGKKRIVDTPIAEGGFAGIGIGAAMVGLRPIIEFMSFNFSFVAADQIISNAPKMHYMSGGRFKVPIVFRGPNGAAAQVSCQHSHCVENIYGNLPGLIIVSPSNAYDAKGLLKSSIRNDNPVLFLESELSYNDKMEVPTEPYLLPLGQASVVERGRDLTIVSYSRMMKWCKEAVAELAKRGIKAELIDIRTIKPLESGQSPNRCAARGAACWWKRVTILGGNLRRDRLSNYATLFRLARRANRAGHSARNTNALLESARAGNFTERRTDFSRRLQNDGSLKQCLSALLCQNYLRLWKWERLPNG